MSVIDWYEHDDDGHTIHHVYYGSVSKRAADDYYGWEPEEPDPIGECTWCEEDIYNEDHIIDGDIVCPACVEYWESNAVAVDFIKLFFGSMPEIAEQCRHDDWMEMFAEYMRECEPDKLKMVMKKEPPCGNTTTLK